MKRLVFIFCLFFSLTAHGIKFERGGKKYTATNGLIFVKVGCDKLDDGYLYRRAMKEFKLFKKQYKRRTIKKHLKRVVFCSELSLGLYFGAKGSYNVKNKTLFIEVNYRSNATEYLLHHEFSSLLLHSNPNSKSLKKQWTSNNLVGYKPFFAQKYGKNQWKEKHEALRMRGFLYPYSRTNFENDFNVMAAYFKADYLRKDLKKAANDYSRINNKFFILKKFYENY